MVFHATHLNDRESLNSSPSNRRDLHDVVHRIENYLLEVREKMDPNYLRLNNEETEAILNITMSFWVHLN